MGTHSTLTAAAVFGACLAWTTVASAALGAADNVGPIKSAVQLPVEEGRIAAGDVFGAEVAVYNAAVGEFLSPSGSGVATFGETSNLGPSRFNASVDQEVVSSFVQVTAGVYDLRLTFRMSDGSAFVPPGSTIGSPAAPVTELGFLLGEEEAVAEPINGTTGFTILGIVDPADVSKPGRFLSDLKVYNSANALLADLSFSSTYDAVDQGVTGATFITAGGADLGTLDIARAEVMIRVSAAVPEPATALGVAGVTGFCLLRRRQA